MGWVSLPLYIFVFLASFSALLWPNIWPKMGFSGKFWKNYWLNSFHTWLAFILMGWVTWPLYIFVFLASFSAPGTFFKYYWLNSFHTWLAFILMGWVTWPLYSFVFLASFSALWGPNIWLKMDGVSRIFLKNYWFHSLHTWHLSLWSEFSTPIHFRVPNLILVLWGPNIWPKMGFPELLEKTIGSIQSFPEEFPHV